MMVILGVVALARATHQRTHADAALLYIYTLYHKYHVEEHIGAISVSDTRSVDHPIQRQINLQYE